MISTNTKTSNKGGETYDEIAASSSMQFFNERFKKSYKPYGENSNIKKILQMFIINNGFFQRI